MKQRFVLFTAFLFLLSSILIACEGTKKEDKNTDKAESEYGIKSLRIATGGTGGTYYPIGGYLAKLITDSTGVETNAITSEASVENLKLLEDGDAQLAFTQSDIANYAIEGTHMYEGDKVTKLQAVGTLYPETIQIVTTKEAEIHSVADLKGKIVSIGSEQSGTKTNAEQILEVYGLSIDDVNTRHFSFDDSTTALQDGKIDAAFLTSGTPTGAIEGLKATKDIVIINLEDDKLEQLINKYPYYQKDTIPAGTYDSVENVHTAAVQAMLVVNSDISEDLVYEVTKLLFESTDKLGHPKGTFITADKALDGTAFDIHPGAMRYFKEKGISTE
ncbi:MAG TPA: TAXI family TRAP transporter solute-binding subunit [Bacillaceae bacterium]|nr:TAXI family TRAP transporter solute-binding subunit [Paenibacillus bovis]HLU21154.1 TAXI family TRAP transporter solute-binding subunit [Bacillaceae bacterium]